MPTKALVTGRTDYGHSFQLTARLANSTRWVDTAPGLAARSVLAATTTGMAALDHGPHTGRAGPRRCARLDGPPQGPDLVGRAPRSTARRRGIVQPENHEYLRGATRNHNGICRRVGVGFGGGVGVGGGGVDVHRSGSARGYDGCRRELIRCSGTQPHAGARHNCHPNTNCRDDDAGARAHCHTVRDRARPAAGNNPEASTDDRSKTEANATTHANSRGTSYAAVRRTGQPIRVQLLRPRQRNHRATTGCL